VVRALLLSLALCLALPVARAEAGKLDSTRAAVRGSSSGSGSGSSSGSSSGGGGSAGTTRRSGGGLPPVLACFTAPGLFVCLPYLLLEQDSLNRKGLYHGEGFFLRYPYQGGAPGRMTIVPPPPRPKVARTAQARSVAAVEPARGGPPQPRRPLAGTQRYAIRLAAEYAYDVDRVHRPSLRLQLELPWRLGLASAWTHLLEPLPGGGLDRLTIGDANLTFRFAQSARAQFWVGLGARLMLDALGVDPGFSFTYGVDLFPRRPLVISAAVDLGNLGLAFVCHGRATVGAALGAVELYAGYDVLLVDPVLFHGPVAGLRVWF